MTQIEIISEQETADGRGWEFVAQALDDEGNLRRHHVRLSWADYNHWSGGGADAPMRVAEAAVAFMLTLKPPSELEESFDASIARRLSRDADKAIPQLIRDGS